MTYTGVTPRERAEAALSAVQVFEDALRVEDAKPRDARDWNKIAALGAKITRGIRVAGVWAQLAAADAIAAAGQPKAKVVVSRAPGFTMVTHDEEPYVALACRNGMHDACDARSLTCNCVCHGSRA